MSTLLAARFLLAAALFAAVAAARGIRLRTLPLGPTLLTLGLGAVYALEAGVYFSALRHVDASVASLIVCTYPVLVLAFAVALRRERAGVRQVGALALALTGALLVLVGGAGGPAGALDGAGVGLALTSTVLYAFYVTLAAGVSDRLDPIAFGGVLCAGAAAALVVAGGATGHLHPERLAAPAVVADVVLLAVVSTVVAVAAFVAGMRRIGATAASTVASVEPFFTVVLAAIVLGEHLRPAQLAGGAVLLGALALVRAPVPDSLQDHGAPALPAPAAAARPLALQAAG